MFRVFYGKNWSIIVFLRTILFLLLGALFNTVSASEHRLCVDALCRRPTSLVDTHGRALDECRACQQCTDNGYSVCIVPKRYERAVGKFLWSRACECAHGVPSACEIIPPQRPPQSQLTSDGRQLFQICYLPSLRMPIKPHAVIAPKFADGKDGHNPMLSSIAIVTPHDKYVMSASDADNSVVLITLEQFWLDDYWRALRSDNLTIHYEFIVKDFNQCHGKMRHLSQSDVDQLLDHEERAIYEIHRNNSNTATERGESFLCGGSQQIVMISEKPSDYDNQKSARYVRRQKQDDFKDYNTDYNDPSKTSQRRLIDLVVMNQRIANSTDVEPDEVPVEYANENEYLDYEYPVDSIELPREDFADAKRLRLYYTFDVLRPRQLYMGQFEKKLVPMLETKRTNVQSEVLIFQLVPDEYNKNATTTATPASPTTHSVNLATPLLPPTRPFTSVSATEQNAYSRWRFFSNTFLAFISTAVIIALLCAYRMRVRLLAYLRCLCCFCCCAGDEENDGVTDADLPSPGSLPSRLGQKRKKRTRNFLGKFYQSA